MDPEHECYKHQGKGIWKAGATLSSLMPGWGGGDGTSALAGFGTHPGRLDVTTVWWKRGTGTGRGAGGGGGGVLVQRWRALIQAMAPDENSICLFNLSLS